MKKEYDFTNAERGKFFNKDAHIKLPVYLDDDIQDFFTELAKKKKTDFDKIINMAIKANMELYKTLN